MRFSFTECFIWAMAFLQGFWRSRSRNMSWPEHFGVNDYTSVFIVCKESEEE